MKKDIGAMIRELRRAAGMSQMRLADKIGISYQQIQKYEKGTSKLNVPRLMQIAGVFGVPVTAFLDNDAIEKATGLAVGSNLTSEEAGLLTLFRRMEVKLRRSTLEMLKDIARASEGRDLKRMV